MLINSLRFYERILLGLHSEDSEVKEYALSCLSYFVLYMTQRHLVLPANVAEWLGHLPEAAV